MNPGNGRKEDHQKRYAEKENNQMKETEKNAGGNTAVRGMSVTHHIDRVKQPRGGYLNPKSMTVTLLGDGMEALHEKENINPGVVGAAVDYLTRFLLGTPKEEAFAVSVIGAMNIGERKNAEKLLEEVKGLDDQSVINAVKLCSYDVCFRSGRMWYRPVEEIMPDAETIDNIRMMVERSLKFIEAYGPKVLDGFDFEGGYTQLVTSGDGDFTTKDTLWDWKVTKKPINKDQTLQLLMYWRMGLHSVHPEFKDIRYLGIFNPRTNKVYRIATADIDANVIKEVEEKVIGYKE